MAHEKNHDYHILQPSIYPFLGALGAFIMLFGAVLFMHGRGPWMFVPGLLLVLYVMYGWWSEVIYEGNHGDHTPVVRIGLRYGFMMFIMSEVMFFAAWFWSFFKHAMYPGGPTEPAAFNTWPPQGVTPFDPWHLPIINTLVLLCSGAAATWAHHALVHENNRKDLVNGLALAIVPGADVHRVPGLRIRPCRLRLLGQHLRRQLLHGDRLPRCPCHHRDDLPLCLHVAGDPGRLHARAACRLRGRRLVLAFR